MNQNTDSREQECNVDLTKSQMKTSRCKKLIVSLWVILLSSGVLACRRELNSGIPSSIADSLATWRADSVGCDGQRSRDLVLFLVDTLHLRQTTGSHVKELLGPPNRIERYAGYVSKVKRGDLLYDYMYYYNVLCDSNGIVPGTDLCWCSIVVHAGTDSVVTISPVACN